LRATCPDEKFRDGKAALKTAEEAWDTMELKDPFALAVLAAAQAELGDYAKAAETQAEALEAAPYTRKKLYKERLAFYEAEQPYRLGETTPQPMPKKVAEEKPETTEDPAETAVAEKKKEESEKEKNVAAAE